MNEKIKQLAEQVGAVQNVLAMGRHDGVLFTETELEMFAELIVKKCANIVWDEAEKTMSSEVNDAGYKIIEHFGVKE